MATKVSRLPHGLNENIIERCVGDESTSPADNGSWTITMPAEYHGKTALPLVRAVVTYGAGNAGKRLATYHPIVDTGSALVGVEVVSYNEDTGVLTLTNRTGGALATPRVIFDILADTQ